jgi:hypothetical protein
MRNEKDRFFEKVNKNTETGCWEWTAAKYRGGYGHFRRKVDGKWKMEKTHRFAYEIHNEQFDKSLIVCHKCDNPSCVNPDHLFLGTPMDNVQDKMKKGRFKVIRNPKHRLLNLEIAKAIRQDHSNGLSYEELQSKYSTSKQQVSRIVRNEIWKEGA